MSRLRSHLLQWLLIPLFILWAIGFRVSYVRSLDQAHEAYDRTLLGSALAMAERVSIRDGELSIDVPYAALEMLETRSQDRIFYKIVCLDPLSVVSGHDDLPAPSPLPIGDEPVFNDAVHNGEPIRLVALQRPVYDPRIRGPLLIQVGETIAARQALSTRILIDSAATQLTLIAVAAMLITFGVRRGLHPLRRIRNEIEGRDKADLRPISTTHVPREVVPLIEAINTHTERQRQLNDAHKQFIANASHQLKTPLTVLKMQAAQALRQNDPALTRSIVQDIHDSTDATARVVQQLLTLARSEPGHVLAMEEVDLVEVARQATFELLSQALAKSIDLEFDDRGPAAVLGQPVLLRELASNLVDNAIRYTPPDGRIYVSVLRTRAAEVLLQVEDTGPGIDEAHRSKVFDRFYRVHGSQGDGCGLGLAIVKQIADKHDARVELGAGAGGVGLRVCVYFTTRRALVT
jgi:two-component system sensor histidine kinase TctE